MKRKINIIIPILLIILFISSCSNNKDNTQSINKGENAVNNNKKLQKTLIY